jgi:hypothetical protein
MSKRARHKRRTRTAPLGGPVARAAAWPCTARPAADEVTHSDAFRVHGAAARLPQRARRPQVPRGDGALIGAGHDSAAVRAGRQRPHAGLMLAQLGLRQHGRAAPRLPPLAEPAAEQTR